MEKGLQQLGSLAAVGGSFVCDNRGDVIASSTPAVLATVTMNTIGREAALAFAALERGGRPATRLDFLYNTWRLLAHDLGDAMLFAVCEPQVDMPMLRMSIDITLAGWARDPNVRKSMEKHRAARPQMAAQAPIDGARRQWNAIDSQAWQS